MISTSDTAPITAHGCARGRPHGGKSGSGRAPKGARAGRAGLRRGPPRPRAGVLRRRHHPPMLQCGRGCRRRGSGCGVRSRARHTGPRARSFVGRSGSAPGHRYRQHQDGNSLGVVPCRSTPIHRWSPDLRRGDQWRAVRPRGPLPRRHLLPLSDGGGSRRGIRDAARLRHADRREAGGGGDARTRPHHGSGQPRASRDRQRAHERSGGVRGFGQARSVLGRAELQGPHPRGGNEPAHVARHLRREQTRARGFAAARRRRAGFVLRPARVGRRGGDPRLDRPGGRLSPRVARLRGHHARDPVPGHRAHPRPARRALAGDDRPGQRQHQHRRPHAAPLQPRRRRGLGALRVRGGDRCHGRFACRGTRLSGGLLRGTRC